MSATRREWRALLALALPATLTTLCYSAITLIELCVVGHLGVEPFAAIAFAQMGMDLSTLLLLQGFNAGLNALCSQAFGAKNTRLLAVYGQLTLVMLSAMCVPIAVVWWHLGELLAIAGVHASMVQYARLYARISILWLWPRAMFEALTVFFQAQQIVLPATASNGLAVVLTLIFSTGLTYGWFGLPAWGIVGCALGTALAMTVRLVAYVAYMRHVHSRDCTSPFMWLHRDWKTGMSCLRRLCAVGFPLALGNLFEYTQLQLVALFSARIGSAQLGTFNAISELVFFVTSPIFGVMTGAVTRIGNHLGAGNAAEARGAAVITATCITCLCGLIGAMLLLFSDRIGRVFSSDRDVLDNFAQIMPLSTLAYVVLGFFYYSMCVLEAQARSTPIMIAFAVGSWGVGVPVAYYLGLARGAPSFVGIWHGLLIGYSITSSIGFHAAFFESNWKAEAQLAVERSVQNKSSNGGSSNETDPLI